MADKQFLIFLWNIAKGSVRITASLIQSRGITEASQSITVEEIRRLKQVFYK
jgi:uridine phosphorylase